MTNNKLHFGFNHRDPDKAIEELEHKLGEHKWFARFISEIVALKQRRRITDIVIRESQPIEVVTPLPKVMVEIDGRIVQPSEDDINRLVYNLLGKGPNDIDSMSSIDFSVAVYGIGILRINYSRCEMGVGLSIRYLDFEIPEFEGLQYPLFYRRWFQSLIRERTMPNDNGPLYKVGQINSGGLILHIGPTGSGKTTAIASEIMYMAMRIDGIILTYENPIEYRFIQTRALVEQRELGVHIREQDNMTMFQTAKYNLLRKAPSVVMFSEVKTEDEIRELIDTASRGHLTLATLHAKDALEALSIMMAVMGDAKNLLARSLRAIVSHYLYLTIAGNIIPIYEIFTPDEIIKEKICLENGMKEIKRRFVTEKNMGQSSITFSQYISDLVKKKTITEDDKREVIASMMIKEDK